MHPNFDVQYEISQILMIIFSLKNKKMGDLLLLLTYFHNFDF